MFPFCNERKALQASASAGACLKAWWSYTCILTMEVFLIPFYTGPASVVVLV